MRVLYSTSAAPLSPCVIVQLWPARAMGGTAPMVLRSASVSPGLAGSGAASSVLVPVRKPPWMATGGSDESVRSAQTVLTSTEAGAPSGGVPVDVS